MSELNMFIPITKVDASQRLVYGIATAECEDRAGEICDYASTKPLYEKWSREIARSTQGKSFGNLRAMHGSVAAGKVISLTFNDAKKQIEVCAKVVDDAEWSKVKEGVYTGFSQGGTYAKRWTDKDGHMRYTAQPSEISLVDLPCLPEARFEMIKADGSRIWRRFRKGLEGVVRLSAILAQLEDLQNASALADGSSDLSAQLQALIAQAADALRDMIAQAKAGGEEDDEDTDPEDDEEDDEDDEDESDESEDENMPQKRLPAKFRKIGARNNAADQERIQTMHDTAVELGAECSARKSAGGIFEKRLDLLTATLADILARVKNIESQPLPLPFSGRARAVSKAEDAGFEQSVEAMLSDPEALSLLAIKIAQRNGRSFLTR
ncbi:MAG TPA: hypothetical protein VKV77_14285 [Methylovirgula sp.]|nr:hypothetical protein [Methylovirgula sp.]